MMNIFDGSTADDVWGKVYNAFTSSENVDFQQSRAGNTKELLHTHLQIKYPKERWVFSRLPAINPAFALAEVFWILSGSHDAKFINYWNPAYPKYAGYGKTYHGAYGYRIRKQFGIDQLNRAYMALSNNSDSRQVVIQIWDPKVDLPDEDGSPLSSDIPCNICSILKVRKGRLEWLQVMRSNDFFLGLPQNVVQFTSLQEIMAGWLGLGIGSYHHISDSLHIYEHDLEQLNIGSNVKIENTDSLALTKVSFDALLPKIYKLMLKLIDKDLPKKNLKKLYEEVDLPKAYNNIILIAIADSARRREWYNEMDWAAQNCSNEALTYLWEAWRKRKMKK